MSVDEGGQGRARSLKLITKTEAKLKPNFIEMVGNNGSNGKQGRVIGC